MSRFDRWTAYAAILCCLVGMPLIAATMRGPGAAFVWSLWALWIYFGVGVFLLQAIDRNDALLAWVESAGPIGAYIRILTWPRVVVAFLVEITRRPRP